MSAFNDNSLKKSDRTSSQRSIYDYPEHLNPFYEDENHQRIRFWKINDSPSIGKKNSRGNSFSLDGLKGLWSFKSFRLKKKPSTLSVNKTSESPPLPRHVDEHYDSQMRHTVNVGLSNNFNRGSSYRSSLQDISSMRTPQNVFFVRNHRYRSTVQSPQSPSGISSSCTVTPTFNQRFAHPSLSHGTSQTSVNSTNPFEDDYVDTVSQAGSIDCSPIRRSGRKKRRAPQPPVSPLSTPNKTIATVEESSNEISLAGNEKSDESLKITNLTAEIESFVKIADTDDDRIRTDDSTTSVLRIDEVAEPKRPSRESKSARQSPENNDYYATEETNEVSLEKIQNLGITTNDLEVLHNSERNKISPVKIIVRAPTDEDQYDEMANANQSENDMKASEVRETNETVDDLRQQVKVDVENQKEENDQNISTYENRVMEEFREAQSSTPTSTEVEQILESDSKSNEPSFSELRITESNENLASKQNDATKPNNEPKIERRGSTTFEVRTTPLKTVSSPSTRRDCKGTFFAHVVDGNEVVLRHREGPTPPTRRRSVKDIIESINKSQSLLRVNQDQRRKDNKMIVMSTIPRSLGHKDNFFDRNMNDLSTKDYQQKKMFAEVNEVNNNNHMNDDVQRRSRSADSVSIPIGVERWNELNGNGNGVEENPLFAKCVVRNGKSLNEDKPNVEWNPVPKPRRHRNSAKATIN